MTKEQRFFLDLLSDHLNGRKTEAPGDLDWDTLCRYAADHQLNGMLYFQCRSFLPAQYEKRLGERYSSELYYHFNRLDLFRSIRKALSAADIPFLSVKGIEIAPLYPIPALRTMGDCDLVVHPEDRDRAHDVMLSLGFVNNLKEDNEWTYLKNDMEFELHDRLLYDKPNVDKANLESTDQAWDHAMATGEGTHYVLDWSFHYLFLLIHLKKHLVGTGVGFRQFLDLAVAARRCELDTDWLTKALAEQNLLVFAQTCSALLERWFGAPLPLGSRDIDDDFYEYATEKIFGNGVFGFQDERNKENDNLNAFAQSGGPRWLFRLRTLLGSVFPSYRNMRYVPQYAFLNGRPWLLLAAWLYRFYRSIRYRLGENGKKLIGDAFVSGARLEERQKELSDWGL